MRAKIVQTQEKNKREAEARAAQAKAKAAEAEAKLKREAKVKAAREKERIEARLRVRMRPWQALEEPVQLAGFELRRLQSELDAIAADRAARHQALLRKRDSLRSETWQAFVDLCHAIDQQLDRLKRLVWDCHHDLQHIKAAQAAARAAQAAARARAEQRRTAFALKVHTRSVKSEMVSTMSSLRWTIANVLEKGLKRSTRFLRTLEKHCSDIVQSQQDMTFPPTIRQRLVSLEDMYGVLILDVDNLLCRPRQSIMPRWNTIAGNISDTTEEISVAIHIWEAHRARHVYEQIDEETQYLVDGLFEFDTMTRELHRACSAQHDRRLRQISARMVLINKWIQQQSYNLRTRHEIMDHLKKNDLGALRDFRIMSSIHRTSKRVTVFSTTRFDVLEWYDKYRNEIDMRGSRSDLVDALYEYGRHWSKVRDKELKELHEEVERYWEEPDGHLKLENARECLVDYAKERLFEHLEETSIFEESDLLTFFSLSVIWDVMRTWPEEHLEAGVALIQHQIKILTAQFAAAIDNDSRESFAAYLWDCRQVLEEAETLKDARTREQRSLLEQASVYHEPRYYLDKNVAAQKATEERSERAYFSYELYRAHLEKDQTEQVHPKLLYHTSHVTHHEVLKGLRGKFVGFDVRWKSEAQPEDGPKANTPLLMIATDSTIHLLHLALQSDLQPLILQDVRMLLESEDVVKVTVGAEEKCSRLQEFLGVNPRGFVDLEDLHHRVREIKAGKDVCRLPLALPKLTRKYLGHGLHPKAIDGTVDPTQRLRQAEKEAMGSSVYAYLALQHAIDRERQQLCSRALGPSDTNTDLPYPRLGANATESERPEPAVLHAAERWVDSFLANSGGDDVNSDGSSRRRRLLSYCLWHYGGFHIASIAPDVSPTRANMLPADILKVVHEEKVPYDGARAAKLLQMLPDEFVSAQYPGIASAARAGGSRTSALEKESDAVMEAQRSAVRRQILAAREWANSRLSPNAERTPWNEKLVRIYFYHRLWHHLGKSVSEIHAEHQPSDPPEAVALCIADAIKLFDMPPRDEESMAELRVMLANDDYLPDTADLLPSSSASTTGPESPEVVDGDIRKHRAAAEGWAAAQLGRAEATGEPLLEAFGGEDGRRHGMLTHYRLWDAYGHSVAAIRDEFFPGPFPMMRRKRFATITEDILAVLDQMRAPSNDRRRQDLLGALPEEAQQRYWKLAGEIARKAESRVNDDGGQVGRLTVMKLGRLKIRKVGSITIGDIIKAGQAGIRRIIRSSTEVTDGGPAGGQSTKRSNTEFSDGRQLRRGLKANTRADSDANDGRAGRRRIIRSSTEVTDGGPAGGQSSRRSNTKVTGERAEGQSSRRSNTEVTGGRAGGQSTKRSNTEFSDGRQLRRGLKANTRTEFRVHGGGQVRMPKVWREARPHPGRTWKEKSTESTVDVSTVMRMALASGQENKEDGKK
ncbi:hypothetical protein SLS55_007062 [Diplodia seriata]|uniref:Uncharacterized protein n=1 Tax=Diplodia seriata TaxID=420778 RepID=A0ABR3CB95_9PEZI